jgi:hypothetical protein
VSVTAGSDKLPATDHVYGSIDSNGYFDLSGAMGPGEVGQWTETWRVGDKVASPVLHFDVLPAGGTVDTQAAAAQAQADAAANKTTADKLAADAAKKEAESTAPASTGFELSAIPTWAWLAGGAAVLLLMVKGNK